MSDTKQTDQPQHYTVNPGDSDPQPLSLVIVGIVGIVLAWVIIAGLEVLYHKTANAEFERKVVQAKPEKLTRARAEQLQQINGYHWIDERAGTVQIPVERAMQLLVEEDVRRRASR